jgi:sugar diacid utilization regulator
MIEYASAISTLITSEYVSQTRLLAEAEGDRRIELLNMLLRGYDESDPRAAQLLRRAGYLEQRQSFCVAVARSVDPREMENTARAQRMADAVGQALRNQPIRVLLGVRDNLVVVVMSGTRRLSGWTAPQSLLADRVYPQLRSIGPAALIGMSNDVPSTSHIPHALGEATVALGFASVAERIMPFSRVPFRRMLVRIASEEMQSALPPWLEALLEANRKSRGALLETLVAYADADMNVLKTAKALAIHPNTIYARMQRINDITGRNPLGYHALTELLLAAECAGAG